MFSFWATAKTLRSGFFRAASMARNVAGRPAPIGDATPGNSTASRSGRTGKVIRSDMDSPIMGYRDEIPELECTVHATTKRHRRQVRSVLRRQSGAWLPTRQSKSIFLASNGLQRRMNDPLAQRLSQALGSSFTLEGEIGRGGMGVVYHARDERLKRRVAVKVLPPELAVRGEIPLRVLRGAGDAARLSHPPTVP